MSKKSKQYKPERDRLEHKAKAFRKLERRRQQEQEADYEARILAGDPSAWRIGSWG